MAKGEPDPTRPAACAGRRPPDGMFRSLRHRNVRLFLFGQALSDVGTWFQLIAVPWAVLAASQSSAKVGVSFALQFLPALLLGPWSGVVIDRIDRRLVLTVDAILAGALAAVVGLVVLTGPIEVWVLYALSFATGVIRAFDEPARRTLVAELVDRDELANAVGLNSAERNIARVISPAITGVTIAALGVGWCFVINAVSFIPVVVALRLLRPSEMRLITPIPRAKGQLREGLRYAWSVPLVRTTLIMAAITSMLTIQYLQVVVPVFVRQVLDRDAGALSIVLAAAGVAALFGSLAGARNRWKPIPAMTGSVAVMGVFSIACAVANSVTVLSIAIMPLSASVMVFLTYAVAAAQLSVPGQMQGRVSALVGLAVDGMRPLGGLIVGVLMSAFDARAGMYVGAVGAGLAIAVGGLAVVRGRSSAVAGAVSRP